MNGCTCNAADLARHGTTALCHECELEFKAWLDSQAVSPWTIVETITEEVNNHAA